jgi:uncharacterized Fe-S radical SAM superfamily protein PflX
MGTVKTKKAAMLAGLNIQKKKITSTIEFVNFGEPNVQAKIIIKEMTYMLTLTIPPLFNTGGLIMIGN